MPMRATEDRKPEARTAESLQDVWCPGFSPWGQIRLAWVVWCCGPSLGEKAGWKAICHRRLGDISESSSLSSGVALCFEPKHPRHHSHKPSFLLLGEQLAVLSLVSHQESRYYSPYFRGTFKVMLRRDMRVKYTQPATNARDGHILVVISPKVLL